MECSSEIDLGLEKPKKKKKLEACVSSLRDPEDYPIHPSEFNRAPILTDTTDKPSRTHLMFIPSVEEMISRGYASETFSQTETARFGDFSGTYDYEDILNAASETREMYEELPEEIRNMFRSPDELLNFVQDPANRAKAVALGILKFNDIVNSPTEEPLKKDPEEKKEIKDKEDS